MYLDTVFIIAIV